MSEPITSLPDAVAAMGALPMPVGAEPRTLDVVEEELTGANLALYEEELENARLRLALKSAQRGRRELRAQVAALLEERHGTNEALDDAVQELRAREVDGITQRIAPTQALRETDRAKHFTEAARLLEATGRDDDAVNLLDNVASGIRSHAELEDPHDGPLAHRYLKGRDLPDRKDPARCLKVHPFSPRDGWRMVCGSCDHGKDADCHQPGGA